MQKAIPQKITTLRNEIYRDIYNKSEWVYVKLQSLFEFIGRLYLEGSLWDDEFMQSNPNGRAIFSYLERKYVNDDRISIIFTSLNERANLIKHNTNPNKLKNSKYDMQFVKLCCQAYNLYSIKLFASEGKLYWLDNSIFSEFDNVTVIPSIEAKSDISKQVAKQSITSTTESVKHIYQICCGAGNQDFGFQVHGLPDTISCTIDEASIYATIYGFLLRGQNINKDSFIQRKEEQTGLIFNHSKVFRYQIMLLLMIRSNLVVDSKLTVFPESCYEVEFKVAAESILDYSSKLAVLSGIEHNLISIQIHESGIRISTTNEPSAQIFTTDIEARLTDTTRDIWFERPIKYRVNRSVAHSEILMSLLYDFFGYSDFKPGQYDAFVFMLNNSEKSLCIMPTGGGKSLIFYFLALMQPGPSLIVSPTNILIEDQIRNMQVLHNINDVQKIVKNDLYQKGHFSINHKFIFLTPTDFQHYALIYRIIDLNQARKISGIILDEVHTISNWSHDFRPDYLMLSFNLLTFADHPRLYGFTATANFRVVNDIKTQLSLTDDSIVLPIELKRTDISFEYISKETESDFVDVFKEKANKIAFDSKRDVDKMLAFTKSDKQSIRLAEAINEECRYHVDVFHANAADSYLGFIKGRKSILIADASIGIGINIPDVHYIMHIGLPISKAQYVQEIGRASRFGRGAVSTVVFKSKESMTIQERQAMDFNTSIDAVLGFIKSMPENNDIAYALQCVLGHVENYATAAKHINELCEKLMPVRNYTILSFSIQDLDQNKIRRQQVYLYFLHRMGIIYNWYIKEENGATINYLIEVEHDSNCLSSVKQRSIDYISQLSQNKKIVYQIETAEDIKSVILLVQQWYYNEFLYYHREQMLNILDFFEINSSVGTTDDEIMTQLAEYFCVGLSSADSDKFQIIASLSIRELFEKSKERQDPGLISQIEHNLENQYQSKFDLFLFFYQYYEFKHFNKSRLERIVNQIDDILWIDLMDNLFLFYRDCSDEDKLNLFNTICQRESEDHILERIFEKNPFDTIYYAYYAKTVNRMLKI